MTSLTLMPLLDGDQITSLSTLQIIRALRLGCVHCRARVAFPFLFCVHCPFVRLPGSNCECFGHARRSVHLTCVGNLGCWCQQCVGHPGCWCVQGLRPCDRPPWNAYRLGVDSQLYGHLLCSVPQANERLRSRCQRHEHCVVQHERAARGRNVRGHWRSAWCGSVGALVQGAGRRAAGGRSWRFHWREVRGCFQAAVRAGGVGAPGPSHVLAGTQQPGVHPHKNCIESCCRYVCCVLKALLCWFGPPTTVSYGSLSSLRVQIRVLANEILSKPHDDKADFGDAPRILICGHSLGSGCATAGALRMHLRASCDASCGWARRDRV